MTVGPMPHSDLDVLLLVMPVLTFYIPADAQSFASLTKDYSLLY